MNNSLNNGNGNPNINSSKITNKEMRTILRIISLERENNKSTKKYSQQEIVNKILTIISKEVVNEDN